MMVPSPGLSDRPGDEVDDDATRTKPAPASNKIGQQIGARGARTRDRLLEAVRALLLDRSPLDLTVSAIALRAGSSPATFYVYFDGIREALLALASSAAATAAELLPRTDSLLNDASLETDVRTMIRAVNAAWDRDAAVLTYRNLESDRGDIEFDRLRTLQAAPLLDRLSAAIARSGQWSQRDCMIEAEAAVLVAAIERIAVRMHRPHALGPHPDDLCEALTATIMRILKPIDLAT